MNALARLVISTTEFLDDMKAVQKTMNEPKRKKRKKGVSETATACNSGHDHGSGSSDSSTTSSKTAGAGKGAEVSSAPEKRLPTHFTEKHHKRLGWIVEMHKDSHHSIRRNWRGEYFCVCDALSLRLLWIGVLTHVTHAHSRTNTHTLPSPLSAASGAQELDRHIRGVRLPEERLRNGPSILAQGCASQQSVQAVHASSVLHRRTVGLTHLTSTTGQG